MPCSFLLVERDFQYCQSTANARPSLRVPEPAERGPQIIDAASQFFERAITHTQRQIFGLPKSRNHIPKLVLGGHRPGAHFERAKPALAGKGWSCPHVTVATVIP